jgi:hypothetical protein
MKLNSVSVLFFPLRHLTSKALTMPSYSFKKIKDYTLRELDEAVMSAKSHCEDAGFDFFKVLNGIDAYMERRARKEALAALGPRAEAYGTTNQQPSEK